MIHRFSRLLAAIALCVPFAAHAAPGDLDTTFGSGSGKVMTAIGTGGADVANALALQPDGKLVASGYCSNGSNYDFCLARYLPNGALDTSFNTTGKVITSIGLGGGFALDLARQADGKLVVAGVCSNGANSDFCVARYLPSGALDPSFNTTGKVITGIGPDYDNASAIALQPDGKLVVAGNCWNGSNDDFCLARYLPSGALDPSFNTTGTVITAIGSSGAYAYAVALQPDGKIVAAGYCSNGSNSDFCLARYLPNGAIDTSLNTTGTVITAIGSSSDIAAALALQPDGKIVVAGTCWNGSNYDFCLARYSPSGALDMSFNSAGKVITTIGSNDDFATALALQPDGKIVVAGYCDNGSNYDFCLARYLANGLPDTSLNATGKVITAIGSGYDYPNALALQPDGKIVAAGTCSNGSNSDFCLARYLPTGALDTSFSTTGKVITAIGSGNDQASALALQPDGKIVVAGYCDGSSSRDFCVARYEGGPFDERNCSMDVDGDNQTFATTDGLIATRVMLGLTGNAVIGGITFASHATRTTWPAIRNYLVTQCGMSIVP